MFYIDDIFAILLIGFFFAYPFIIMGLNIWNFFKKNKIHEILFDVFGSVAGLFPKFHKAVRGFCDRYGYPVSCHITSPMRADIVYIPMKPLEYIFVFVLYLFDNQPENRIAVQYSNYKRRNSNAKKETCSAEKSCI